METKKAKRIQRLIVLLVIAAAVACYFLVAPFRSWIDNILRMFATGDFAVVKEFVQSYGPYAMVVSALLMIFRASSVRPSLLPMPIPARVISP